jgi:hypothetical protein
MSSSIYHRSRMFKVSTSLLLSTAYFVAAIGVWMVNQGQVNTSADSVNPTCTPPHQATDNFNAESRVDGGEIAVPAGWTKDSGTLLTGWDRNISSSDSGDAWMGIAGRIQRPIKETRQGKADFVLASFGGYGTVALPNNNALVPFDVALFTKSGTPLTLRITPSNNTVGFNGVDTPPIQYRDPLSGEFKPVQYDAPGLGFTVAAHFPVATAVNHDNTFTSEIRFTVEWDGTNFTVNSPYATQVDGNRSKSYRYAQNEPTSMTGIALTNTTNQSFTNMTSGIYMMAKQIVYPAGVTIPCITSVQPSTVAPGATAQLTGINFTGNQETTVNFGNGKTAPLGDVNGAGTTGVFTVPADVTAGTYNIFITNNLGQSGTVPLTVQAPQAATFTFTGTVFEDANGSGTLDTGETKLSGKAVTLIGNGIDGAVTCTTNVQQTDTFDALAEGATDNFDWQHTSFDQTSFAAKLNHGKTGKGLALSDTNAGTGLDKGIYASRLFPTTPQGTVSLDVRPAQTNAIIAMNLRDHSAASNGVNFIYVYFYNDGTVRYWDGTKPFGEQQYVQLGTATYQANQWHTVKIDWTAMGFDVTFNGTKLTPTPISYPPTGTGEPKPSNNLTVYTQNSVGSFDIDNVEHPDCAAPVVTGGRTVTTDANGGYAFNDLAAGIYRVVFLTPGGYTYTKNHLFESQLGPNASHNFGIKRLPVASGFVIRGTVFEDSNTNGTLDASERKIAGQTVQLLVNNTATASVTTDANGGYAFAPVAPGTYVARINVPAGFAASPSDTASVTVTDADKTVNFGMKRTAPTTPTNGGGTTDADNKTTPAAKVAAAAKLVSSGGSLGINLAIAGILSLGTTYLLLHRRQTAE